MFLKNKKKSYDSWLVPKIILIVLYHNWNIWSNFKRSWGLEFSIFIGIQVQQARFSAGLEQEPCSPQGSHGWLDVFSSRPLCGLYFSKFCGMHGSSIKPFFRENTLAPLSRQIWQNILLMESWFIIIPYDPNDYCSTATFQSANHAIDKDDFDPFDDCLLFNNRYTMMMS